MTGHQRALGVLAIAQTLCLACGLWIGDQFLLDAFKRESTTAQPDSIGTPAAGHLLVVRVLTLVWIGGLQIGVAYMVLTRLRKDLSQRHSESEMRLLHREKDLVRTRNAVSFGLAKLADYRDQETGQHLMSVNVCNSTRASVPSAFVRSSSDLEVAIF